MLFSAAYIPQVYGVLLRPLPYAEPAQLVRLWQLHPGANATFGGACRSAADGGIVAIPQVGGLHHRYERRAA